MGVTRFGLNGGVSVAGTPRRSIRRQVMMTTALTVPALFGYGPRQAYAACANSGGSTYLCSGNETTTQTVNANNANVTMDTGATVDTSGGAGNAITITGDGNLSFTNMVGGAISSAAGADGLSMTVTNGIPNGSITINSTQAISGGAQGIFVSHSSAGTGGVTINAASATGTTGVGIFSAINDASNTGDVSITTTGVVSGTVGIQGAHAGQGALTINAASASGSSGLGIYGAINNVTSTSDLSITATGAVSGAGGIRGRHQGRGGVTINAASVTATSVAGIRGRIVATNATGALSITATGAVQAAGHGIDAYQQGAGGVTINAASVTSTGAYGIYSRINNNTSIAGMSITATGAVSGQTYGIGANHFGRGALTIKAASVTGTTGPGIYAAINSVSATGNLSVTSTGAVIGQTSGINAFQAGTGVLTINAASASGSTGNGLRGFISNAGNAADMNITATGAVSGITDGIQARHNGSGDIAINITSGGSVTGVNDAINTATGAQTGTDTVMNAGTITGTVDLGGGVNAFNNNVGGVFNSGATVVLGAGNTLTNAGIVSPGGSGAIGTTALTGNFVQTAAGTLQVDLDPTIPSADLLSVSGTADLAGSVALVLTGTSQMEGNVNILTAVGGVTDNGLAMATSPTVSYQLLYPDANSVAVEYVASFAREEAGLTPNQSSLGGYLNMVMEAGGGGLTDLLTSLLGISDNATYQKALDQLQGEHQQNQTGMLFGTNRTFMNNLLSCPERLDGNEKAMADKTCVWSRVDGRKVDVDRSTTTVGGDETTWGFSGGYETAILNEDQVRVGGMFSVEDIESDSNSGASSSGTRFKAGAKIEKGFGDLEASFGLFGGITNYDTTRPTFGGAVASSDHDITFGTAVGRVSYSWDAGPVRVVPMLDLVATHLDFEEVNETGAGAANLRIDGTDEWILSATPAVGVVGTVAETEDVKVHASLQGGVSFYSKSELSFRSHFIAAPVGVGGFTTTSGFDDVVGNVSGALQFEFDKGLSFKAGYDGRFGDLSTSHGGYVRAVMPF